MSEREADKKLQSFCNLILEVIIHYFCSILIVRSEPLGTAYAQEEELRKGLKQGLSRAILGAAYISQLQVSFKDGG